MMRKMGTRAVRARSDAKRSKLRVAPARIRSAAVSEDSTRTGEGSGAATFLRKLTGGAATVFMLTSIVLAYLASHNSADSLEKFGENQAKLAAEEGAAS